MLKFVRLVFIDFLHILPIIITAIIVWKKNKQLDFKYVGIISLILVIWTSIDRPLGLAYTEFPIIPIGLIIIIAWPIFNLLAVSVINYLKNRKLEKKGAE